MRPGQRVLDAGTGSGILAVTAVLFGASEALGFDFDPNAEPYANELFRLWKLGQFSAHTVNDALIDRKRHQIRVRKITVIMRLFFFSLTKRNFFFVVPAARFLHNFFARF